MLWSEATALQFRASFPGTLSGLDIHLSTQATANRQLVAAAAPSRSILSTERWDNAGRGGLEMVLVGLQRLR